MSFNQSRSDKGETQYRKTGGSASFNRNYGGGGGSYGRGGGAASHLSGTRSFKKCNYNAQGGEQQPQTQPPKVGLSSSGSSDHSSGVTAQCGVHNGAANQPLQSRGASNAPVAIVVTKPTEQLATQGSTRPVVKAPSPKSSAGSSDAAAPKTPVKTAGEGSQPFQFQFGSISPGCMNGMQIPARTSSAPPNLDEQKHDQARHAALKVVPALPPSLPRHQLQRKEAGAVNQSGYGGGPQLTSQVKRDFQGSPAPSIPAPIAKQGQKPLHLPISGIPMQMIYAQPQSIQYAAPGPHLQSQGMTAPQMPMPMPIGNAPQMAQQVFIPGLQPHLMQSQGMIHQGQSLTFANPIAQLPHQLGSMGFRPQYPQQQGEKYGGQRKTVVKITDPKTREELKFDKHSDSHTDGVSSGPKAHSNLPSQSNNPNMYFAAPSSLPMSTSQITPTSQAPRLSYSSQASQNISFNSSSHSYKDAKKAGSSVDNARGAINVASSTTLVITQLVSTGGASGDKVLKSSVSTKTSADEKIESPRQPPFEASNSFQSQEDSAARLAVSEPKSADSESVPVSASAATNLLPSSVQPVESFPGITTEHRQKETLCKSSSTEDQSKPGNKGKDSHQLAVASSVSGDSVHESSREPLAGKDVSGPTEPESDLVNAGEGFEYVSSERPAFKSYGRVSESAHLAAPDDPYRKDVRAGEVRKETCSGYDDTSKVAEFENRMIHVNVGTLTSITAGFVDGKHVPSNLVSSVASSGDNGLTLGDSFNFKDSKGSNEFSASSTDVSDICSIQGGEGVEKSTAGKVSPTASESKDKPNSEPKRPASARSKKKRKEFLQKADAQGTYSDLYMAYKGPEEKKEDIASLQGAENDSGSINAKHKPEDALSNLVEGDKVVQSKAELDDWEDAADISSPKLETSGKDQVQVHSTCHGGNGDESMAKRYSRDFLLKFAEQFTSLPEGFEVTPNVAGALVTANVNISHLGDTGSYPSSARVTDRQSGGPRLDRRGSSIGDDDRWNKVPSLHVNSAGLRSGGVLRNPRAQVASQFPGGILSGPMQNLGPYAGLQRNNSDADRWQRGANFQQKGLIPSPHTPLQVMHRAEKKYQVGKATDEEEAKQRQLKGILNKLTPQNFERLFEQVKAVNIDNADTLTRVISQIFDKALMEPTFCEMYANFCSHLAGELPDFSKENEKITFKRLLLNKCQEEFERGEREQEEANKSDEGETKLTEEEREERRVKARRRMLGNIRLIGELYKKKMLTERIMHECIQKLLGQSEVPDEEDIESLCKLMATIGVMIDHSKAKVYMDSYFERMILLSNNMELSSRVRFMLKDVVDLRKNRWQERRKVEGPKKIEDVHRDAAQERHLQSSRLTRGAGTSTSARRGPSMDFGSRGPALSSPGMQMGGLRGLSPQVRGYGAQDGRFEERQTFEARTLSVPLHQRLMGDESITLGPQGGLARGMASGRGSALMSSSPLLGVSPSPGDSRRLRPSFSGYSSVSDKALCGTREDFGPRSMQDRYASQAAQESSLSYSNRDLQNSGRSSNRIVPSSPYVQGEQPASVHIGPIQSVQPEEQLQIMSMAAIKEFYSAKDEKEVALCVKDLNSPSFHPSMVSLWVMDSFERKDMERDLLAKLLVVLTKSTDSALSQAQLVKGFESVLSTLEDAVTDAPRAPEFLGRLFAKVVSDNVVSLNEIGQLLYEGGEEPGSLREAGLAADVLGSTLEAIKLEKGESSLNEIRVSSNLRLEDFRPPDSYRSRKLELFI